MRARHYVGEHGLVVLDTVGGTERDIVRRVFGDLSHRERPTQALFRHLLEENVSAPFTMIDCTYWIYAPAYLKEAIFQVRVAWRNGATLIGEDAETLAGTQSLVPAEMVAWDYYLPEASDLVGSSPLGRGDPIPDAEALRTAILTNLQGSRDLYAQAMRQGLCYDQARLLLPPNRYVGWWWKINLWHLLAWLAQTRKKNLASDAMAYRNAIEKTVKDAYPGVWDAWDNVSGGAVLTREDLDEIRRALHGRMVSPQLARKILP